MRLCLRGIRPEDSAMLLRWRNDPETRRNSLNTTEVSPEEHARWFCRMIRLHPQRIAIAEMDGLQVGVIRFDWNDEHESYEISFTVAPQHRRKGLGFRIVQQETQRLSNVRLLAKVKVANIGSRRIFDRLGFRVIGRIEELLLYARDPVEGDASGAISPLEVIETSAAPRLEM
jgi:UDP-2,4-diacetamido-2,4,6-trideoxy-beta-L-altropyranose hydrolase